MPDADKAPKYSADTSDSYNAGYNFAIKGNKSNTHDARLIGITRFDIGYTHGWKKQTEAKLHKLLTGETN